MSESAPPLQNGANCYGTKVSNHIGLRSEIPSCHCETLFMIVWLSNHNVSKPVLGLSGLPCLIILLCLLTLGRFAQIKVSEPEYNVHLL